MAAIAVRNPETLELSVRGHHRINPEDPYVGDTVCGTYRARTVFFEAERAKDHDFGLRLVAHPVKHLSQPSDLLAIEGPVPVALRLHGVPVVLEGPGHE